jgi:type III pantothenate kinase
MILGIDVGNTTTVFALIDENASLPAVVTQTRIDTRQYRSSFEYATTITHLCESRGIRAGELSAAVLSNVVPRVARELEKGVTSSSGQTPVIVNGADAHEYGITIATSDPESVGGDIVADCVGGYQTYGGPILVVDFGTATKYIYVDEHGKFSTVAIGIGIGTGTKTLTSSAALLPKITLTNPGTVLGTDTESAMRAGLFYGFLGGIERTITEYKTEVGTNPRVVATGGLGRIFADATELIDSYDHDLLMRGLGFIAKSSHKL